MLKTILLALMVAVAIQQDAEPDFTGDIHKEATCGAC